MKPTKDGYDTERAARTTPAVLTRPEETRSLATRLTQRGLHL